MTIDKKVADEIAQSISSLPERQRRMVKAQADFGGGGKDSCDKCGIGYYVIKRNYKTCYVCGYNPNGGNI